MLICNHWPRWFRDHFGDEVPQTYATFDTETTGFSFDKDVIWNIAHVLVVDGKIENQLDLVLDWTNHKVVPGHWIQDRLNRQRQDMVLKGLKAPRAWERMKAEGKPPEEVLSFYNTFFRKLMADGVPLVSHNGYAFDEKMLAHNFAGFSISADFKINDSMWDTVAIEKGNLIMAAGMDYKRFLPQTGETMRRWCLRVKHANTPGIKPRIDDIVARYGFEAKYGLTQAALHGALSDSRCIHYLIEEYRNGYSPVDLPLAPWEAPRTEIEPFSGTQVPRPSRIVVPPSRPVRRRGQRCN